MAVVRTAARWSALVAMIAGAAISAGIAAVVQACGGKAEPKGPPTESGVDGSADADSGPDGPVISLDGAGPDIAPTNDVSLDTVPAE